MPKVWKRSCLCHSEKVSDARKMWGTIFWDTITDQEMSWLRNVLVNTKCSKICIFVVKPPLENSWMQKFPSVNISSMEYRRDVHAQQWMFGKEEVTC